MPKSGKPQKRNLSTVAFIELQKYLLLNVGFKMFDRRKYPAGTYMLASGLSVRSSGGARRGGHSAFGAGPESDRGTAPEPECLGSFPCIPACFSCDLGHIVALAVKPLPPHNSENK